MRMTMYRVKQRPKASMKPPMPCSARLPVAEIRTVLSSTVRVSSAILAASRPAARRRQRLTTLEMRLLSASCVTTVDRLSAWYSKRLSRSPSGVSQTQAPNSLARTRRSSSLRSAAGSGPGGTSWASKRTSPPSPLVPGTRSVKAAASCCPRPAPVASTIARRCSDFVFDAARAGPRIIAAMNTGSSAVAIQKPLLLRRVRYSRLPTMKACSGRIAHRLDENVFEVRLLAAELPHLEELQELAQQLGGRSAGLEQQPDAGIQRVHRFQRVTHIAGHRDLDFGQGSHPFEVAGRGRRHQPVGIAARLALDLPEVPGEHQPAVRDQADVVAQLFGLLHPVGREQDRLPLLAILEQQLLEQPLIDRIEPREGLVEDQDVGLVQHGADELHFLLHALRQLFDFLASPIGKLDARQPPFDDRQRLPAFQPVDLRQEQQLVDHRHLAV